mmetsp:Transcript_17986/g.29537  ORF Transcript_17986/g.29537 Transcript_17986/m.29537 type:complete len:1135 (+) Transcript_17986:243-3647(+)|eukprot:CAMPEP_0184652014 /NCGR_PEP_ID=MMETSP0308-20130426/9678_1 /TAXON_ID=38269 /ORGANISM="Gloeochaete witrockiana, Strain SAG 46.84" /LENGTH=1134 /DNA_ID=CAMNT_0027086619 /DNA_START=165 /DNA_END=3569 /DNA_ORIENTATION=+
MASAVSRRKSRRHGSVFGTSGGSLLGGRTNVEEVLSSFQSLFSSIVHPFTLRFKDQALEDRYSLFFYTESAARSKIVSVLTLGGAICYSVLKVGLSSTSLNANSSPQFAIVLVASILTALTWSKFLKKDAASRVPVFVGGAMLALIFSVAVWANNERYEEPPIFQTSITFLIFAIIRFKLPLAFAIAIALIIIFFVVACVNISVLGAAIYVVPIITGILFSLPLAYWLERSTRSNFFLQHLLEGTRQQILTEKKSSDELLENILPSQIVDAYLKGDPNVNRAYKSVTIVFIKLLSIPAITRCNVRTATKDLNVMVSLLEDLCTLHDLEKIKTVGASFMAVAGLPTERPDHVRKAVNFALEAMSTASKTGHKLKIGMHCGPVAAGIVGSKFFFDVWGDSVNTASRMCITAEPDCVQVSADLKRTIVAKHCRCKVEPLPTPVDVKGKGMMETFLISPLEDSETPSKKSPPSPLSIPLRSTPSLSVPSGKDIPGSVAVLDASSDSPIPTTPNSACVRSPALSLAFIPRKSQVIESFVNPRREAMSAWDENLGMIKVFGKRIRYNLGFPDSDLEREFVSRLCVTTVEQTRWFLALFLLHSISWVVVDFFYGNLQRLTSSLVRYCAQPMLFLLFLAATFWKGFSRPVQRRLVTNLFNGLLLIILAVRMILLCRLSGDVRFQVKDAAVMDTMIFAFFSSVVPGSRYFDGFMIAFCELIISSASCLPLSRWMDVATSAVCASVSSYVLELEERRQFLLQRKNVEETRCLYEEHENRLKLLRCCLPEPVIAELSNDSEAATVYHDHVAVIATDIVGFTAWSSSRKPATVLHMLDDLISSLDALVDKHRVQKIKTVGDAYLAVVGLNGLRKQEIQDMMALALDVQELSRGFVAPDGTPLHMRIGIAIGGAAAGIIGKRKWFWDLWGEAVTLAEHAESTGSPNRVHVTEAVYERAKCLGFEFEELVDPHALVQQHHPPETLVGDLLLSSPTATSENQDLTARSSSNTATTPTPSSSQQRSFWLLGRKEEENDEVCGGGGCGGKDTSSTVPVVIDDNNTDGPPPSAPRECSDGSSHVTVPSSLTAQQPDETLPSMVHLAEGPKLKDVLAIRQHKGRKSDVYPLPLNVRIGEISVAPSERSGAIAG